MNAAIDGASDVFGQHGFGGIMADAAGGAQENHGGGNALGENHRVVARAAGHAVGGAACGAHGGLDLRGEKRIHGDGRLVKESGDVEGEIAAGGDFLSAGGEGLERVGTNGVGLVADVESEACFARNDVGGAGLDTDDADGGDQTGSAGGFVFDGDHPCGGGGEGVAASVHGRGACVIGHAGEGDREA